MTGHEDDILGHLERAIADDDPDLNGQAPEPQPAPQDAQPAPQQPMDFAQEQPQTPVNAGAPEEPQQAPQGPAPQLAPAPQTAPGVLNANQMAQKYNAESTQNATALNNAYTQKQQAATDLAGIQQARNDEIANADIETQGRERDFQKARDVLDNLNMNATRNVTNLFDQNVAAEQELAAKDPHDFWGNSGTVNKIGAIIALVGAGVAHHDASKAFQQIIDNRVAETQRKRQIYQQIGHDLRYKQYAQNERYHTEIGVLNAKRVAAINDIQRGLKIKMNTYANPEVLANLQATYADLDIQKAKDTKAAIDAGVNKNLDFHRARLDEARLGIERDYKNAQLGLQADKQAQAKGDSGYYQVAGISNEGVRKDNNGRKFVEDQAITGDLLNSLDNFEHVTEGADTLDVKQQKLAVQKAFVSGDIRKKLGVGARVEGEEGKNMALLLPAFNDYFAGKIGYGDLKAKINEIRDLIINSHLNRFNSVRSANSEITPEYPLYKSIQGYAQRKQAQDEADAVIDNTIAKDADNPEKAILDVSALGTPQAKARAAQMQEELHPSLKHRAGQLLHRFKETVL